MTQCCSETAPKEGTLQVFPDVLLANAYIILRPFFKPVEKIEGDPLDAANWKFGKYPMTHVVQTAFTYPPPDITSPDFPGIYSTGSDFTGPLLNPQTHPHLRLDQTMVSVPKVYPGDMVFWHCVRLFWTASVDTTDSTLQDLIHAVEVEHQGPGDSSGTS